MNGCRWSVLVLIKIIKERTLWWTGELILIKRCGWGEVPWFFRRDCPMLRCLSRYASTPITREDKEQDNYRNYSETLHVLEQSYRVHWHRPDGNNNHNYLEALYHGWLWEDLLHQTASECMVILWKTGVKRIPWISLNWDITTKTQSNRKGALFRTPCFVYR